MLFTFQTMVTTLDACLFACESERLSCATERGEIEKGEDFV